jgi:hypothetical protein
VSSCVGIGDQHSGIVDCSMSSRQCSLSYLLLLLYFCSTFALLLLYLIVYAHMPQAAWQSCLRKAAGFQVRASEGMELCDCSF